MMKRLTFDGNFCDIAQCKEFPCPYNGSCSQREVWEKLKAYEATERIRGHEAGTGDVRQLQDL